jgi:hypothetical protein
MKGSGTRLSRQQASNFQEVPSGGPCMGQAPRMGQAGQIESAPINHAPIKTGLIGNIPKSLSAP